MARPERNNVDYFPFYCKEGKAMHYIEHKYGNDGYATWIKILRQLAVTNHHYLNLSDKVELMYLSSKCRLSEEVLQNIISDLCDLGEFNRELWDECRVVFSEKFNHSIQDAYSKRNSKCMDLPSLLLLLTGLGVRKPTQYVVSDSINAHSIVEDSKVKKKVPSKRNFLPPTLEDVKQYFTEKGYTEYAAQKAFNCYNEAEWHDTKGNKVLNWKQKMNNVWFTPENQSKPQQKRGLVA